MQPEKCVLLGKWNWFTFGLRRSQQARYFLLCYSNLLAFVCILVTKLCLLIGVCNRGCDWLIDWLIHWLERQWAAVLYAVKFILSFPLSVSTPPFSYLFWIFPPIFSLLVPSVFSPLLSCLLSSVLFCPQFSLLSRCLLSFFISSVTLCFILISFCNSFRFLMFCHFFSLLFSSPLSGLFLPFFSPTLLSSPVPF
jgi:hypothetical protein